MKEEFTKFNLEDYLTTDELRKEYLNQVWFMAISKNLKGLCFI
ncbi:hypothetical protein [Campylobacter concisus]|nr:hypothetical protein [Campylobacter concisus]